MASTCDWVDELFPPKFKLASSFDSDETKTKNCLGKSENAQKTYENVYRTLVSFEGGQASGSTDSHSVKMKSLVKSKEFVDSKQREDVIPVDSLKVKAKAIFPKKNSEVPMDMIESRCMWNADELKILRKSFKRSKLHNIRLSVMVRSLQNDCEHLKDICQKQAKEIVDLNKKYNEAMKQNRRMKITCKAFREDAKKFSTDFVDCQERMLAAVSHQEFVEQELFQAKMELEATKKQNKMLVLELENQKKLQDSLLNNQKIALERKQEGEVHELTVKLEEFQLKLKNESNVNTINKQALEHLRLHFAAGRG